MKNNFFKKLSTGMNTKKLLLFLPAFFAPLAFAMDKEKSPKPLVYLAALKVKPADLTRLPTDLAQKAKDIQRFDSTLKHKINAAEVEHYSEVLQDICTKKTNSFTIEDIYNLNRSLVELQHEDLFKKCIINNNRIDAEWLLSKFPTLLDHDLKFLLAQSVLYRCMDSFNLLTDKLYLRTPPKLHVELTKTILKLGTQYKKPVASWLTLNQVPYLDSDKFLYALAQKDTPYIKDHLNCLDQIIKEQKHHALLKDLFKDMVIGAMISEHNAFDTVNALFENPDFIKFVQPEIRSIILNTSITARPQLYTQLLDLCSVHDETIKNQLTAQLQEVVALSALKKDIAVQMSAVVTELIKYGANPCQTMQFDGRPILPVVHVIESFSNPNLVEKRKIVQALLSKNPQGQINHYKINNAGNNLLCCNNSYHYIDILTAAGCLINERNNWGGTPLYKLVAWASEQTNLVQAVEKFLFYGADPYVVTNDGKNLLWLADGIRETHNHLPDQDEIEIGNLLFGPKPQSWGTCFKLILRKPISMLTWSKQKAHPFENATMKIDSKKTITALHHYNTELAAILQKSALFAASKGTIKTQPIQTIAPRIEDID